MSPSQSESSYNDLYREFDSALMRQLRLEAYGKDIGQHSWVTAEDLEEDIARLKLSRASHLLDLGCGPAGPLAFVVGLIGCHGHGVDVSAQAIAAGLTRVSSLGLDGLVTLHEANLDEPIAFKSGSFDAVMSLDVVLHLRDRAATFLEVARVLVPGGRFLFTDAAVITGSISNDEIQLRSSYGAAQFVPEDFNQRALTASGMRLIETRDRTASLLKNARGRLAARLARRAELLPLEGTDNFERHQRYLETVIALSERGALSRVMYLAEAARS